MEILFKGKCPLTEEMQREEGVDVVVEYSDMKSETDLKSELATASRFQSKTKIRASKQNIFTVKKGNELI
jgi:hypothetical protein